MLNLKELIIRNFRSFGDEETRISLDNLGAVLLIGRCNGDDQNSNGSGKTSCVDAIIWCLFGKVPTKDRPADSIINWNTKKNCIVTLITCDGYTITRTREANGHDDLLVHSPDGKDESLSTNPNTQAYLNKLFDLDYDIFMSSTFFGQFSKPFLELPDQKRKKALERMLHLTRYDVYAEVAKEMSVAAEAEQAKFIAAIAEVNNNILFLTQRIDEQTDEKNAFDIQQQERVKTSQDELSGLDAKYAGRASILQNKLITATKESSEIETYDLDKLEKDWAIFNRKTEQLNIKQNKVAKLKEEIMQLNAQIKALLEHRTEVNPDDELANLNDQLSTANKELEETALPEEGLEAKWENYNKVISALEELGKQSTSLDLDLLKIDTERGIHKKELEKWESKKGTTCSECGQLVPANHVHKQSHPIQELMDAETAKHKEYTQESLRLLGLKNKLEDKKEKLLPSMTLKEATSIIAQRQAKQSEIETIKESISQIEIQKKKVLSEATERAQRIDRFTKQMDAKNKEMQKENDLITAESLKLGETQPKITLVEGQSIKKQYDAKIKEIEAIQASIDQLNQQKQQESDKIKIEIKRIQKEENPHIKIITQLVNDLQSAKEKQTEAQKKIDQYNSLIKHLDYIKSSFSDRRKIKAHTLGKLVPYLNQRIAYYLDALNCSFTLEFNAFLQTKSDTWPYDQHSGGERKRVDLAVMFAIYDLHASIYEQRCNILVLDEVDGRLDASGVSSFINLLYKEFVDNQAIGRPKTIFVISHKNEMRDAFPTKMLVEKVGPGSQGISRLIEVA